MKLFHPVLLGAVALLAPACTVVSTIPAVPLAPPGVHVRAEVARGYAAYAAPLMAWGTWIPDHTHGVLWCPGPAATHGEPFQPYLNHGHWDVSDAPIGQAPAGSPVWRSEPSDTWSEITSHHGWWVRVSDDGPSPWCWVPGAEETAARVLWREGDGFVGWAPEPPDWVACDEADYDDSLDWVFTLLGTLLDGLPDQNQLTGPARSEARSATAPARLPGGSLQHKQAGPSGASVTAARKVLVDYVLAHPDAIAATYTPAGGGKSGSKGDSGKKKTSDEKARTAEAPMLPSAMQYYDAFLAAPPLGPAGFVPGARTAGLTGAGRGAAGAGYAQGSALSAAVDAHAHARAEALRLGPSSTHGGSAWSRGYSSSGGSTYSYTPSGSSHSSGSHHHGSTRSSRSHHR